MDTTKAVMPAIEIAFAKDCAWRAAYLNVRKEHARDPGCFFMYQVAHLGIDPSIGSRPNIFGMVFWYRFRISIPFMRWAPGQSNLRRKWQNWIYSFDGRNKNRAALAKVGAA